MKVIYSVLILAMLAGCSGGDEINAEDTGLFPVQSLVEESGSYEENLKRITPDEALVESSVPPADDPVALRDQFWDEYVFLDVLGKSAQELFGGLSTYYWYPNGYEVLCPYEDSVFFDGPVWEPGSKSVIAQYQNRGGSDYRALVSKAYPEAPLLYDDAVQLNYLAVFDRGYELRFYVAELGDAPDWGSMPYIEFRLEGYEEPFWDSSLGGGIAPEVRDTGRWSPITPYISYLGTAADELPEEIMAQGVSRDTNRCFRISFSGAGTWFAGKSMEDVKSEVGVPFSLCGSEENPEASSYEFFFSDGVVVSISSTGYGGISEEPTISIYRLFGGDT